MHPKRVERIRRHESLPVPQKHPKRARLWFADGSWIRRRADYPHHGWSYDCVRARTQDGRPLKRGCWSSMHTPASVSRLRSDGVSRPRTSRRSCVSWCCSGAARRIVGATPALSVSPRRDKPGMVCWPWRPYSSSRAVRGSTEMANPSTAHCRTKCPTAPSSLRCTRRG